MSNITTADGGHCRLSAEERRKVAELYNLGPRQFALIPPSEDDKIILAFFMSVIMAIALIANSLVLVWIKRGKDKKNSVDVYIVSLCIADFLTVTSRIPFYIDLIMRDHNYYTYPHTLQTMLCKGLAFLQTATLCISQLTLVFIALDRYVAICHPLFHYKNSKNKRPVVIFITVSIWIVGMLLAISDPILVRVSLPFEEARYYNEYGYHSIAEFFSNEIMYVLDMEYYKEHHYLIPAAHPVICQELYLHGNCGYNNVPDNLVIMYFILSYVLPLLVMAFCYLSIVHRLWIRKPVGDVLISTRQNAKIKSSTKQTIISMMVMVAVFGLLWLPYWVLKLYKWCHSELRSSGEPNKTDLVDSVFTVISYLPIVSSPIIYLFMDRACRELMKNKLWGCR